jgi:hypothetical protein
MENYNHDILEALADQEHARWSNWQRYLHSSCEKQTNGSLVIPAELVERWERQLNTDYKDLSELEKESARKEAINTFNLIGEIQMEKESKRAEEDLRKLSDRIEKYNNDNSSKN